MKLRAFVNLYVILVALMTMSSASAAITVTTASAKTLSGNGSFTPSTPAGAGSGDVLIAQIVTKSTATVTPPTGWTLITSASTSQNGIQQRIYYLNLSGSAGSYSFTISGNGSSDSSNGVIYDLSGASAANCGSAATTVCAGSYQAGGGTQITAPNVQSQPPTYPAGSLRMAFFAANDGSVNITPTLENSATAGVYNRAGSGSTGVGLYGSYYLMPSADNGSQQTASLSGSGANNIGSTFIITAGAASSPIDHVQLEITGTPLTCTPSTVTVKACTNSACSTLASTSTTVTLSASSGTLGSSSLTFTGSTTTTLQQTTVGTVTLGATSSPAATNSTVCLLNGATASGCQYSFANSGLLLTIPTQTAGVTSSGSATFSIAAVRASDNGLYCTPAFANVTRTVKLWSNYTNPTTGTKTLAVNGTAIAMNATTTAGSTSTTGTSLSLSFDSTGTASGLTLNYADAGQLTLDARYDGSSGTSDTSLVMTGSTAFVTIPYALCVDSPNANWNCSASSSAAQTPTNCAVFTSAGTSFNLRVSGRAYQASTATCSLPVTPNYQQSIPVSSTVFAPTGGSNGTLGTTSITLSSGGTATTSETQSEVGVFTLTATPAANAYFGATVPAGSANFGRFVPAGFTVSGASLSNRSDVSCPSSSFTYLGESLGSSFTLNAVNAAGTTTQNYTGSYARMSMSVVTTAGSNGLAFGVQSGSTLLNSRMSASCTSCGAFSNGSAAVTAGLTVLRATGSTVDGPFTGASFGLVATDADSVGMKSPNWNYDLTGAAEGVSLGTSNLWFGRMRVDSAYGSSVAAAGLVVPAYAQYWNGSVFVKNTSDSCTQITVPATYSMSSTTTATLYCSGGVGLYGSLTGVAATSGSVTAGNTATLSSGSLSLALSKPTNSGGGYLDLALSVPVYLKYNVDNIDQTLPACTAVADSYLHDDNPRVRVRFGARRNDNVIYLREVY